MDNGCTNYTTHDENHFIKMDRSHVSKVRISNDDIIVLEYGALQPLKVVRLQSCVGSKLVQCWSIG